MKSLGMRIQNWAFLVPCLSRDISEYFEGVLDAVKADPYIFLHTFTFDTANLASLARMDGIISYMIPPPRILKILNADGTISSNGKYRRVVPVLISISMCRTDNPNIVCAHINPNGVAARVFSLLKRRFCRAYAFCSNHVPYFSEESAVLLSAYRRQVYEHTGTMPHLFRPAITSDLNLIPSEINRFVKWFSALPHPLGMFVHGDDVARKMLDTCRLKGIRVPDDMRVIGTSNSSIYCERTFPTLSSYAINHHDAGLRAANLLRKILLDRHHQLPSIYSFEYPSTDVIERGSSVDFTGRARLVHNAIVFIRTKLDAGQLPTLSDIAFHLKVSERKIEQDFIGLKGHTIRAEINDYRMKSLCKVLLSSNASIKQLVLQKGFGTLGNANRAFKARFGVTMSDFRKQKHIK